MLNGFKRSVVSLAFSLLILSPAPSFAWRYNGDYGDNYWVYHGSGRDYPYSDYIDNYYTPRYAAYPAFDPNYIDGIPKTPQVPVGPVRDFYTVNIPNERGGYNAVVIRRSGSGFIGPNGEYYPEFPKIFQLEIIYGK